MAVLLMKNAGESGISVDFSCVLWTDVYAPLISSCNAFSMPLLSK